MITTSSKNNCLLGTEYNIENKDSSDSQEKSLTTIYHNNSYFGKKFFN